jgi:hypothetical protein
MSTADQKPALVQQWRECNLSQPPYIFPGDLALLEPKAQSSISVCATFAEYTKEAYEGTYRKCRKHSDLFQLGLIPIPYSGDLESASVFILMLNPGLNPIDYFAETNVPEFRNALGRTLRQENVGEPYPFIYFDPRFSWHSGAEYWVGKFRSVLEEVCGKLDFQEALSLLSRNIAILQVAPYHSTSGLPAGAPQLESTKAIIRHLHEAVIPRADAGDVGILAMRGVKRWALPDHRNIVKYSVPESRAGHITAVAKQKILERLGI